VWDNCTVTNVFTIKETTIRYYCTLDQQQPSGALFCKCTDNERDRTSQTKVCNCYD
jgi:hypothetical protein